MLLRRLDKIDGIKRISFMTSHPKDLSEELIDAMAQCEHVSNQLHLLCSRAVTGFCTL